MRFVFPLLFVLFCLCAKAQPALYFEKLTTENGLSHNKVNCILQDGRGFIWIGTNDGLNRFDGKNFLQFYKRSADPTTISGNIITDLLEDKHGVIWIATADGGLNRYDYRLPPRQQFKSYRQLADKTPVNNINTLIEDSMGYLWVGTSGHSVLRFDKKKELFIMPVQYGTKTILDLSADDKGVIWAGRQGGGILKVNPHTLSSFQDERYFNLYAKLPHASVTALYRDKEKNMWYGSWDKVLYRFNVKTQKEELFQTASSQPFSFFNDQINAFAEDGQGWLWLGGNEGGLQIFDKNSRRFYRYYNNPAVEGSLADNHINCIYIDKTWMVWIGTNRGLNMVNAAKQQFTQTFLPQFNNEQVTTIYDFFEDDSNTIWIGTNNGIYTYDAQTKLFVHRPITFNGKSLHVTKFFKDVDGRIYLGTNVSLFVYEPLSNKVSLLPNTEKDKVMNQIIDSRVVSIVRDTIDKHPVLLVAPYGHYLAYYDLVEQKWISRLDSGKNIISRYKLQDNLIRKFVKNDNGVLWMATARKGLGMWRRGRPVHYLENVPDNNQSLSSNHVFDVVSDGKDNLWVSTYGGGLHYFDCAAKAFTQVASTNNLMEGLQTDLYGNIWTISNGDLHKYDPRRKVYTSYDLPDLEKTGGVKGMIFRDSKGYLYAAGTNYFFRFHPQKIKNVRTEPKVCLTDFAIFNQSVSHLLFKKEIQLRYKENYFTIEYAAPDFSNASVQYSYQLEGFNKDWVNAGTRNFVSYSNLDGGNYTFKVRASVSPGVWSKDIATMRIVVIPPYWKQPWFYLLCTLAVAAIIYTIYRYRINEIMKRQAIRNKIAQDLHDNVGSTLSSISIYSQVAKIYHNQEKQDDLQQTLEKISTASSDMISELNDTVWAINPRNDHMNVILQRMESFARPLLSSKNIKFRFEYDEDLVSIVLSMEKRKNFYLIFKEAINNSLKYSGCQSLSASIRCKGTQIIMKIQDDGKGFDVTKTSEGYKSSDVFGGGNGLKNMQLRAKEMKGKLAIWSEPGKGTSIEITFPITGFGDVKSGGKK